MTRKDYFRLNNRLNRWAGMVLSAGLSAAAFGQSFNIDINVTGGAGSGAPSASFGGAAAQPGVWNVITTATSVTSTLNDLAGAATSVTFTRSTAGFMNKANSFTSGDFEKLIDDAQDPSGGSMTYSFNNLPAGRYALYTYAVDAANNGADAGVNVVTAMGDTYQYVAGNLDASHVNQFTTNKTHALHAVNLAVAGGISVTINPGAIGHAVCAGFQLRALGVGGRLRVFVNDNAAGADIGTSWTDAYPSLQTALIDAVDAGGAATEVWVAGGFYYPTTGTDRSATFNIPNELRLFGGFDGTEVVLADRVVGAVGSYLTGSIGGATQSDNSYTVVTLDTCNSNTIVDGFFIARGRNDGSGTSDGKGAGCRLIGSYAHINNCNFDYNECGLDGGAMYVEGGGPYVLNCLFYQNDAYNGMGGGIYYTGTSIIDIVNCRFLDNTAIGYGGGLVCSFSDARVANCLFSGNHAGDVGGAAVSFGNTSNVNYWNCTVANNTCSQTCGGVIARSGAAMTMHNSILWDNTATVGSVQDQNLAKELAGTTISVQRSIVKGWTGSLGGAGNNGSNPLFTNALGGDGVAGNFDDDLRLAAGSPAIDSGDNALLPTDYADADRDGLTAETLSVDLDGESRRVDVPAAPNTGVGSNPLVDRGAYEAQVTHLRGDANCDGLVNFFDIDPFLQSIFDPAGYAAAFPGCDNGDVNEDGSVDFFDIDPFLNCLFGGCP